MYVNVPLSDVFINSSLHISVELLEAFPTLTIQMFLVISEE